MVGEPWDLEFFASEAALGAEMEAWFPAEVDYVAYDSEGRRLELLVDGRAPSRRKPSWRDSCAGGVVGVRATESAPGHAAELAALLRAWLPQLGEPCQVSRPFRWPISSLGGSGERQFMWSPSRRAAGEGSRGLHGE